MQYKNGDFCVFPCQMAEKVWQ